MMWYFQQIWNAVGVSIPRELAVLSMVAVLAAGCFGHSGDASDGGAGLSDDTALGPDSNPDSESVGDSDSVGDTETSSGTDRDSEWDAGPDGSAPTDTDTGTPTDLDTDPGTGLEVDDDAGWGADTNTDTETGTGTDSALEKDSEKDAGVIGDTDSESDTQGMALSPFSIEVSVSDAIPTVGIVEWSLDRGPVDGAFIEFGPDTGYGIVAPDDPDAPGRTLLLGMKPSTTYHFRIVARVGEETLTSDDQAIATGPVDGSLPKASLTVRNPERAAGGFTVTTLLAEDVAVILDEDGSYVWWYEVEDLTPNRARMSYDGRYMLMGNTNVRDSGRGAIVKVGMDGLSEKILETPDRHHDFTVLPEGGRIAFIEFEKGGLGVCDRIVELAPDGTRDVIYTLRDDFGHRAVSGEWCHSNFLRYVPSEDAYYLSVLDFNSILKIDRASRSLVWELGGTESDFGGATWVAQHGHQVLDGAILLFNNNNVPGAEGPSHALVYALDDIHWTASLVWDFSSGHVSRTYGDVQRMGNGNTVVTFSNDAVIQEVDAEGNIVRELVWQMRTGSLGYALVRNSLYGGR